jgi:hypothetical protein
LIPVLTFWFQVTLREQGTPEQHKIFLEKAENYEYIGCYAQTELGHGSNVRGLETTATWNPEDKTFTMHSPHLTASKWWIGSLGKVANHAVVMAQLVIDGKGYGPHPFVVQIRDLKTHEPLENVHVGDIGPKFGYNTMDNGFLLFNKVKIPHQNMLARFSSVDPKTNKYLRPSSPSLIYGTLTYVRLLCSKQDLFWLEESLLPRATVLSGDSSKIEMLQSGRQEKTKFSTMPWFKFVYCLCSQLLSLSISQVEA